MITKTLLIGINHYRVKDGAFNDLEGCLNDVELIAKTLEATRICPANRRTVIVDDEATFDNVLNALSHWSNDVQPGEHLFLYYSGHGTRVPDVDGDEESGMDEAMVTHDFSRVRPMLDDIFHYHFLKVPQGAKATVIFDCCHSGGLPRAPVSVSNDVDYGQARGGPEIPRSEYTPGELTQLAKLKRSVPIEKREEQVVVLAACQPWQQAWERKVGGRRHGLFTYAICDFLSSQGIGVSAKQAIDYAYQFIQSEGFNQTPRLVGKDIFFGQSLF